MHEIGINIGTTESYIAVIDDGQPLVIPIQEKTAFKNKKYLGTDYKSTGTQELSVIIQKLKQNAEKYVGVKVDRAVITVPSYFYTAQRQAVKDAAKIAGIDAKRLISEATAAGFSYDFGENFLGNAVICTFDDDIIDISVLRIDERVGVFEVLSVNGGVVHKSNQIDELSAEALALARGALGAGGLTQGDTDKVLLVGSAKIPEIRKKFETLFGKKRILSRPREDIVIGAAIQAGKLYGMSSYEKNHLLLDAIPHTISIEESGGIVTPIIEKNSTIPNRRSKIFSTVNDNQSGVEIKVLEGETINDCKVLNTLTLNGLSPVPKGVPLIEVEVDIDSNGTLDVSARDLASGKEEKITITNPLPFSYKADVAKEKVITAIKEEEIEGEMEPLWISPKEDGIWNNKGVALLRSEKYKDAIKCFNKAVEINPKLKRAKENKKIAEGKLKEREAELKKKEKEKEKNNALKSLEYAHSSLEKAKKLGISTEWEEEKLNNAKFKFDEKDFPNATKLANECKNIWNEKVKEYEEVPKRKARQSLDFVYSKMKEAEALGIDVSSARDIHRKAVLEFDHGGYEKAIEYAEKAKKLANERNAGYDLAFKSISETEEILSKTRSEGVVVLDELLTKSKQAFDDGNYVAAIQLAEKLKSLVKSRGTRYSEASECIKSAKSAIERARDVGCDISSGFRLLEEANAAFNIGNYEEAIEYAKQGEEDSKRIKEESKPEISLNFPEKTFPPNRWKKVDVTIRNTGSMHTKEIDIKPSGDIEFRRIPTIPQLNANETEAITIAMKPTIAGDVPIDIVLTYKDALGRDYISSEEVWVSVADPTTEQTSPSEPIPPSDFTPRPTTPSTFPPELAHLYHDPVYAGKGGFARVFKAKRNTDNKTVAIKIPISLDEGTGRSFLREITSWQRLNHENIITLYDANILPIPYLEMEYADSGSLDQMNKPISIESASELILGIAEGLSYSHAQGVIHRDLKPMNVLLTEHLTPKISDWGLSKIIAESKTSSIYGFSPLYGSPEQISPKKFGKPDERTDIYQLGVIFYELLTGRTPFEGDDLVEVSTAIATEEPEPPSSINPEAEIIDRIILKCLEKKKEDRYQNVRELQNDLASALKTQLKESLRMSVSVHNMKRSAFYCAEICLMYARLGEIDDVVTYLKDMQNYASEEVKIAVAELLEELERRKGMSSEEKISEEFVGRLKGVLHQVRMGR